ncbi:MAG: dimethyl sulfoxide reductase anchor subunit [Anaerolineales bacterium]|nr:dimethyl sulfoxide reductase anchor subunit [Anaerolineales bacterium]
MKERSLVVFSILSQAAVGAFWTLGALYVWATRQAGPQAARELTRFGWLWVGLLMGLALLASFFHLGAPARAWRAFSNLRSSWLSREIVFAVSFAGMSLLFAAAQWLELGSPLARAALGLVAGLIGLALIYAMGQAYRLRTVPAWDTWITGASFFTATFLLGALAAGAGLAFQAQAQDGWARLALQAIAVWVVILLGLELAFVSLWLSQLTGSEAARNSAMRITHGRGALFKLRLAFAALGILAAGLALLGSWAGCPLCQACMLLAAFGFALACEVLGRALFYTARVRHGV